MKKKLFLAFAGLIMTLAFCGKSFAGEVDILVDKLVEKGILTPVEAQIILDETKHEVAKELAKGEASTAPEWTQRIKVKGDVRFRTQYESGKHISSGSHHRLRERIRARLGVEGKVVDSLYGGIRIATGSDDDPRSTNQTLTDVFEKWDIWFDQGYIRWEPKADWLDPIQESTKIWLGKFPNPFVTTALMWDGDINPEGIGLQYISPAFGSRYGMRPIQLYGNFAMMWLDEESGSDWEQMLFGYQGGVKMDVFEDWGSKLDLALGYYTAANVKGKTLEWSAGTNGLDASGNLEHDFDMVDIVLKLDNKRIFDLEMPHGFYTDFLWNVSAPKDNFGWLAGTYIGKKKPKKPGDWKLYGEYRYLQEDAVLDVLPDSDFYGYDYDGGGSGVGGGTNGQGFVLGANYALLKNTVLGLKYYYTDPIKSGDAHNSYMSLLQADVSVKF